LSQNNLLSSIDLDKLEDQRGVPEKPIPPMVKGRTVHIDADFLAYMVSYDDNKPVLEMQQNCDIKSEKIRLLSGAEHAVLHITPKESTKGDRHRIAIQKEYQANRDGKQKPKYLHMIRQYMQDERGAVAALQYEADDSMCMAIQKMRDAGTPELAVIATKDKDLTMIPGLQLHWDTGDMEDTKNDFGYITLDRSKKAAKVRGRGYKYFFAQLLMGDQADNIQGIPKVIHPEHTAGKVKPCGPVVTYSLLDGCNSVRECFDLTKTLFKTTGEAIGGYKHWETNADVAWHEVMISEMKLLWMRRYNDENDVLKWLKEQTT